MVSPEFPEFGLINLCESILMIWATDRVDLTLLLPCYIILSEAHILIHYCH